MELFWEILKIIIPAVIVLLAVYFTMKQFFQNEQRTRQRDVRLENIKTTLPVRLQAYERLILFLERIHPESLIIRSHTQGMSAKDLHKAVIRNIRQEYEHNITQQMYISLGAWNMVTNAQNNIIKLFNMALEGSEEKDTGIELSKKIVEAVQKAESMPTTIAINYLKEEVKRLF
jgi:hypothetical protein